MLRNLAAASPAAVCFTEGKQITKGVTAVRLLAPPAERSFASPEGSNWCSANPWHAGESREPFPYHIPCTSRSGLLGRSEGYVLGKACRAFLPQARWIISCRTSKEPIFGF